VNKSDLGTALVDLDKYRQIWPQTAAPKLRFWCRLSPMVRLQRKLKQHIQRHDDHSALTFFKRTISAQLHLLGFIAGIVGLFVLTRAASEHPDARHFWASLAFGVTSLCVFGASTFYHFMSDGYKISKEFDMWLHHLDHYAIYLFIAGTYTPFIFNVIAAPWDMYLIVAIWTIAVAGIAYTYLHPRLPLWMQHRYVSTAIYVLMGWTLIVKAPETFNNTSTASAALLVAGGLSYTFGAVIYALKRPNPFPGWFGYHEIWHIAVIMGATFHYFLILGFYQGMIP
jgi:hemolysin III